MTVVRPIALVFGLLGALAPAAFGGAAFAQTNIDQGKTPAEIFASDCATCHKTMRGLASGQNSLTLSSFLREHYTSSRDQAGALAAYVLGAGGGQAAPKQKPGTDRTTATRDEPKSDEPKGAARPGRAAAKPAETASKPSPEAEKPASASLERRETRPEERPASAAPERREAKPATAPKENATASREKKEPVEAPPAQNAAPVMAAPAAPASAAPASAEAHAAAATAATGAELPGVGPITNAAAPTEPSEAVPRDHIPD